MLMTDQPNYKYALERAVQLLAKVTNSGSPEAIFNLFVDIEKTYYKMQKLESIISKIYYDDEVKDII